MTFFFFFFVLLAKHCNLSGYVFVCPIVKLAASEKQPKWWRGGEGVSIPGARCGTSIEMKLTTFAVIGHMGIALRLLRYTRTTTASRSCQNAAFSSQSILQSWQRGAVVGRQKVSYLSGLLRLSHRLLSDLSMWKPDACLGGWDKSKLLRKDERKKKKITPLNIKVEKKWACHRENVHPFILFVQYFLRKDNSLSTLLTIDWFLCFSSASQSLVCTFLFIGLSP